VKTGRPAAESTANLAGGATPAALAIGAAAALTMRAHHLAGAPQRMKKPPRQIDADTPKPRRTVAVASTISTADSPATKTGRGRPRKAGSEPVGIQAVDISLDILGRLLLQEDGMNLSELSRACGLAPSKLHRYLVSLTRHGMLRQSAVTGRYDFGPLARRMGAAAFKRHHGLSVVHEAMSDLAHESRCTVYLYIWTELGPTLMRAEMGTQSPPISLREGTALPASGSATGRVFLAYLPQTLTKDVVDHERKLAPGESFRCWSDEELAAEFEVIRAGKVYWTRDAILPGPLALAPVFDAEHHLHSVIAVVPRRGGSELEQKRLVALLETQIDRLARELP
jgi:DNA-binding IclR family transcriptional regulator